MPRPKVFTIGLSAADREFLSKLTVTGMHPARMIIRARVLLELDENAGPVPDRAVIADRVGVSQNTVRSIAKRFGETDGDVLATIGRKPRETPPVAPIVTGEVEARLIALACSAPPEGYSRWSLRLLERHVALVEDLPDLDHSTIGRVLKKRNGCGSSGGTSRCLWDDVLGVVGLVDAVAFLGEVVAPVVVEVAVAGDGAQFEDGLCAR